jgi:poly(ribitol-phosphate) beta-N-acetylglucosaminyltransferase
LSQQPTISICIPTYNRGKYLRCLLGGLMMDIGKLVHSYEIVIADNGSTDNTQAVVAEYADKLTIRYIRRDRNYGGHDNLIFVQNQARGLLQMYVGDDDALMLDAVRDIVDIMLADPALGVVFTPWKLHDLVKNQALGQFYKQDTDIVVEKGDYRALLSLLLQHAIFPEIYIYRRALWDAVQPRVNNESYYAFTHAAEFVSCSRVLFHKKPYYISITSYFADEQREQAGIVEVEDGWDRYRGGLEYIFSRFSAGLDVPQFTAFTMQIQQMIAQRIGVALRVRLAKRRDMIECYYLANRLKAMGYAQLMPIPYDDIALSAAMLFLARDEQLLNGACKLVCIGDFAAQVQQYIVSNARVPVVFEPFFQPDDHAEAVICLPGSVFDLAPDPVWAQRKLTVVGMDDIKRKFS